MLGSEGEGEIVEGNDQRTSRAGKRMAERVDREGNVKRRKRRYPRSAWYLQATPTGGAESAATTQQYKPGPNKTAKEWRICDPDNDAKVGNPFTYPEDPEEQAKKAPAPFLNPALALKPDDKLSAGNMSLKDNAAKFYTHNNRVTQCQLQRNVVLLMAGHFLPPNTDVGAWVDKNLAAVNAVISDIWPGVTWTRTQVRRAPVGRAEDSPPALRPAPHCSRPTGTLVGPRRGGLLGRGHARVL